jgi:hypothetical protein
MARLKEKIKDLQATYGITEDAAKAVLALHEGDLQDASTMLDDERKKVVEWNQWYTQNAPNIQASMEELDALRAKFKALEAAGFTPNTSTTPETVTTTTPNTPNLDSVLDQREQKIYQNFSSVQRDLYNIQRQHLQNYKELPDLTPIEKLIEEKKMTPWAAYQEWVAPMEKERTEKVLRAQITQELTEQFQNQNTRQGVNSFLSNRSALTGEEITSPLDEAAKDSIPVTPVVPKAGERVDPSEMDLMADFVGNMRNGRAAAH